MAIGDLELLQNQLAENPESVEILTALAFYYLQNALNIR